jgi:hypothetical protein
MFKGLFRRQNFDKAVGKGIKNVGLRQVEVEGSRVELGKDINTPEAGVNTI